MRENEDEGGGSGGWGGVQRCAEGKKMSQQNLKG